MEFNLLENFWKVNSGFLAIDNFLSIYEKDTSEDKRDSSKLLWAVSLCAHPKSPIFSVASRWEQVKSTILDNPRFNWETKANKKLVEDFKDVALSVAEKSYLFWCDHMKKREEFANLVDYKVADGKTIELVEGMLSKTPKLYEELDRIQKQLNADLALQKNKPVQKVMLEQFKPTNMSKNKKPSFSLDGLATHVDKFAKVVEQNFQNMGMHLNYLQQELKMQVEKNDYLLNLLLKDKDFKKIVESNFTEEEFNKQYEPLLGKFYFDKENKTLVEVELLTKGYTLLSSTPNEAEETFTFVFNNLEKGTVTIVAKDPAEALSKLKYKLRHPLEIIHG